MSSFKKATKQATYIKVCVTGASGSGKTMSAIRLAKGLVDEAPNECGKIAVIDTENNSASLYSDRLAFDALDLQPPFESEKFVNAVLEAEKAGYKCVILDSGSHLWEGVLDYKDKLDNTNRGASNSFTNWRTAGEKFKKAVDTILQARIHVIVCLRSKQEYVIEQNERGKSAPKRVGMAPVFRDGAEYEFTVILDISNTNSAVSTKDRTGLFPADRIIHPHITEETGKEIRNWLTSEPAPQSPLTPAPQPPPAAPTAQESLTPPACQPAIDRLRELLSQTGITEQQVFKRFNINTWAQLSEDMARQAVDGIEAKLAEA